MRVILEGLGAHLIVHPNSKSHEIGGEPLRGRFRDCYCEIPDGYTQKYILVQTGSITQDLLLNSFIFILVKWDEKKRWGQFGQKFEWDVNVDLF